MGEAERGEAAPRNRIPFWCANRHETRVAFASDADHREHTGDHHHPGAAGAEAIASAVGVLGLPLRELADGRRHPGPPPRPRPGQCPSRPDPVIRRGVTLRQTLGPRECQLAVATSQYSDRGRAPREKCHGSGHGNSPTGAGRARSSWGSRGRGTATVR